MSKEFKVGLLTVVAGVTLYFGFNFLKGKEFLSSNHTYFVVYDNIGGLQVSNPVTLNGLAVGRVSDIIIKEGKGNRLLVAMEVLKSVNIPAGSKAVLTDGGLLGGKSVHLEMAGNTEYLQSGDTLLPASEAGIAEIFAEKGMPLIASADTTMLYINALLREYLGMGKDIKKIAANVANMTDSLNLLFRENRVKMNSVMTNMDRLTRSLAETEQQLKPILANTHAFTDSLKALRLNALLAETQATVGELKSTVAALNSTEGTMGLLLKDDSLYRNLNKTVVDLDMLFLDLKENPSRYVNISVFGGRKNKD